MCLLDVSFRYYFHMTFFSFQVLSRLCRQPIIIYIPEREVILPAWGIMFIELQDLWSRSINIVDLNAIGMTISGWPAFIVKART